jgi:hypothetical protein
LLRNNGKASFAELVEHTSAIDAFEESGSESAMNLDCRLNYQKNEILFSCSNSMCHVRCNNHSLSDLLRLI